METSPLIFVAEAFTCSHFLASAAINFFSPVKPEQLPVCKGAFCWFTAASQFSLSTQYQL